LPPSLTRPTHWSLSGTPVALTSTRRSGSQQQR
jgi:hypothetical protein